MKTLLPLLLLPLLTSCISQNRCNRLFPPSVTVKVDTVYTPVQVEIPGETITEVVRITDSLIIKELTERVTVRETDQGRAELRYWVDSYGNLVIECEAKDKVIEYMRAQINTQTVEVRKEADWKYYALVAAVAFVMAFVVVNGLTNRK